MNRTQGFATATVLLVGAWLRPGITPGPSPAPPVTLQHRATPAPQPPKKKGDGPWLASCKYWEPARSLDQYGKDAPGNLKFTLTDKNGEVNSSLTSSGSDAKSECEASGNVWGIPTPSERVKPDITAIIAVVPDPVHTHMGLEYDRAIDALMQAGADNGYLRSFYWLPWKLPTDATRTGESPTADETAEQKKREEMPGLIVLKHVAKGEDDLWTSYDRVIYLFLVGESPASGMNGMQMRNALRFEGDLKQTMSHQPVTSKKSEQPPPSIRFSMLGPDDLQIIGPDASGAAASLREAVEEARAAKKLDVKTVHIAGTTGTKTATDVLNRPFLDKSLEVCYVSFGVNTEFEKNRTLEMLGSSGYDSRRFALLVEDGTVFGNSVRPGGEAATDDTAYTTPSSPPIAAPGLCAPNHPAPEKRLVAPLVIRFPREISLLRNAQTSDGAASVPSPYLHLTLKDSVADDTIPQFSKEQTPLSQEAALMSIQRELMTYHVRFLAITASDILDEIFLANFLHRACPDIRLLFLDGGDLLFERESENQPYIGSLAIAPYSLAGLWQAPNDGPLRAFPDSQSEAMYNAASYTFHDESSAVSRISNPTLAGYQSTSDWDAKTHSSLWATVVGSDGYYPLGIISHCASDSPYTLPSFVVGQAQRCNPEEIEPSEKAHQALPSDELQQFESMPEIHPSLLWTTLSILLGLYCLAHTILLWAADYWSPFTRDLAIKENDQPQRRSVYMDIAAVMLFSMAWVLELPVLEIGPAFRASPHTIVLAWCVLAAATAALICTGIETRNFAVKLPTGPSWPGRLHSDQACYLFFNGVAVIALAAIPWAWGTICRLDQVGATNQPGTIHTRYGMFFSYRCLHPGSGVSPVVPVFLVLLGWYLWALCQTYRLRFSSLSRPRLPGRLNSPSTLFVSDHALNTCEKPQHPCLYANIGCLLITREILYRFLPKWKAWISVGLAVAFLVLFCVGIRFTSIQSIDRLLLRPGGTRPTLYEALLTGLLVPLGVIALAGWLRAILVWGSLRRGLLEPLERSPLRGAFTRLKGLGWMAMMRETGLHLRWKDMARTSESIRQLVHNEEIRNAVAASGSNLSFEFDWKIKAQYTTLSSHLETVGNLARGQAADEAHVSSLLELIPGKQNQDLPEGDSRKNLAGIHAIESDYAAFCELLLQYVLIPYWLHKRAGFVEGETTDLAPIHARRKPKKEDQPHDPLELHTGASNVDPEYIQLAEELLALRYVSLIRAVLGNLRYLMTFVAAIFVLTIVAWNSYPFQPRQLVDWTFTLMFLLLGGGILSVLAQMHRNAILSRITDTSPNELGFDFYWRLATLGAIPLLTWLAYQFPQIGSGIFRTLQPGLNVVK